MPSFIDRTGEVVPRHPYTAASAEIFTAAIAADRAKLQAIVDSELNRDPYGRVHYALLSDTVLLSCAEFTDLTPNDTLQGRMNDHDLVLFIPVLRIAPLGPWPPLSVRLYSRHNFVGAPAGMAAGREVFGFNKTLSSLRATRMGPDPRNPSGPEIPITATMQDFTALTARCHCVRTAKAPVTVETVVQIDALAGPSTTALATTASGFSGGAGSDWMRLLVGMALGDKGLGFSPADAFALSAATIDAIVDTIISNIIMAMLINPWSFGWSFLAALGSLDLDDLDFDSIFGAPRTVTLQQFRDASLPDRACYQALVETDFDLELTNVQPRNSPFAIEFPKSASHELASELGLTTDGSTGVEAEFAVVTSSKNFRIGPGDVVWRDTI